MRIAVRSVSRHGQAGLRSCRGRKRIMSEGAIFMIVCVGMFPALIIVAVVVKLREIRQAKSWLATPGKVVASGVKATKKTPGEIGYNFSDTDVSNDPLVEYEYKVDGHTYRGHRI